MEINDLNGNLYVKVEKVDEDDSSFQVGEELKVENEIEDDKHTRGKEYERGF